MRLVDERRLLGKALAPGVDAVADQASALADALLRRRSPARCARRRPSRPAPSAGGGSRSSRSPASRGWCWRTSRARAWRLVMATSPGAQTSGTASGSRSVPAASTQRLDVDLAQLVRARHDPQAVGRGAAVELGHEVEAVRALVPVRAVPVRPAVLVPGDRSAQARLLDPQRLVEGREVGAVDRRRDGQQARMAIDAQRGLGELQRAQDQIDDLFRRVRRRPGARTSSPDGGRCAALVPPTGSLSGLHPDAGSAPA